jgi:hypothetical protein
MLANKFRVFLKPIELAPENADSIIRAGCVLHNFIRRRDGVNFDVEEDDDVQSAEQLLPDVDYVRGRPGNVAMNFRNAISGYFSSPAGAVPWQDAEVQKTSKID